MEEYVWVPHVLMELRTKSATFWIESWLIIIFFILKNMNDIFVKTRECSLAYFKQFKATRTEDQRNTIEADRMHIQGDFRKFIEKWSQNMSYHVEKNQTPKTLCIVLFS